MGLLDLLGLGTKTQDLTAFLNKQAVILDVRSPQEFKAGHIANAVNIPLQEVSSKIKEIKKWNKPVITCCQSGMRSQQAYSLLKSQDIETINGGGWQSLNNQIK